MLLQVEVLSRAPDRAIGTTACPTAGHMMAGAAPAGSCGSASMTTTAQWAPRAARPTKDPSASRVRAVRHCVPKITASHLFARANLASSAEGSPPKTVWHGARASYARGRYAHG